MSDPGSDPEADAAAIRALIERWAHAVRAKDLAGILAHHSADMLMFDVPPPFESKGIEAYKKSWDLFFSTQPEPIAFYVRHMDIAAGAEVAFVAALMQCAELDKSGKRITLDFRLTVGLCKIDGQWLILHEHHSVPAI